VQPCAHPARPASTANDPTCDRRCRSGAPAPADAGTADSAVATAPDTPRVEVDPKSIRGYVRGTRGPDAPSADGKLTTVETKPRDEFLADLRFVVSDARGKQHLFELIFPRDLPVPFAVGDRVAFRADWFGGGPNQQLSLVLSAADGSTLLAVDMPPEGWKIERGKRTESDYGSTSYITHSHGVVFTHAGTKLEVAPGAWARLGDFYVRGSAAVRTPRAARLPRDYVGEWLDSAVVRAR
jgi:hypothetical protein